MFGMTDGNIFLLIIVMIIIFLLFYLEFKKEYNLIGIDVYKSSFFK